jgi:hypothetical protein
MKLYSQAWECMESVAHEGHTPHGFFGLLTMILGFVKQKPKSFLQVFQLGSLGKWRPNGPNLLQISKGSSIYQVRISFDRHPTRYLLHGGAIFVCKTFCATYNIAILTCIWVDIQLQPFP